MSILTSWIKPPQSIKGRDPFGVRVPCEIIYNRLLPGITNVTDRARYYSFYPWLVWAIGQHYQSLPPDRFVQTVRRADCLYTLIGIAHKESLDVDWNHIAGLIGSQKLPKIYRGMEAGEPIQLSSFTRLDDTPQRYFKNKLGGLGQYYLGPMRELGILDGDANTGLKYTSERGLPIAKAFDQRVPRKAFFRAVEADEIAAETLQELSAFCPCHLTENPNEQQADGRQLQRPVNDN